MDIITANSNPRVKKLNKLNKDAGLRKAEGVFVVEGIRMFVELPMDRVVAIYISESAYGKYEGKLQKLGIKENDSRLSILSDSVFATVSQTKSPQGLMAVVKVWNYTLQDITTNVIDTKQVNNGDSEDIGGNEDIFSSVNNSYLILESIQDPGNLGTIMRTAEAAGITGVIIGGESCDMYNPKVVRSTMGAIFRVPFIYTDNLVETINQLKEQGVTIYGAHLKGTDLYEEVFEGAVAFLIGNEGNGLSEEVSATATKLIKIPMAGKVESLNAATSAALLSYEAYRQRIGKK